MTLCAAFVYITGCSGAGQAPSRQVRQASLRSGHHGVLNNNSDCCHWASRVSFGRFTVAMAALPARASLDCSLPRKQRCEIAASTAKSPRAGSSCQHSTVNTKQGAARRGLALEATCLDQVDFGVSQRGAAAIPGSNAAKLMLRRNEVKDQRKRWSISKVDGDQLAAESKASSSLAAKLGDRQPTLARIVLRAQHAKETAAYQASGVRDVSNKSKRIRSRGQ